MNIARSAVIGLLSKGSDCKSALTEKYQTAWKANEQLAQGNALRFEWCGNNSPCKGKSKEILYSLNSGWKVKKKRFAKAFCNHSANI